MSERDTFETPDDRPDFERRKGILEDELRLLALNMRRWGIANAIEEHGEDLIAQALDDEEAISPDDDTPKLTPAQQDLRNYTNLRLTPRLVEAYSAVSGLDAKKIEISLELFTGSLNIVPDFNKSITGLWMEPGGTIEIDESPITTEDGLEAARQIIDTMQKAFKTIA